MSTREQKQLAGLLPQRPSLAQVRMDEGFNPELHPYEIAHAKKGHPWTDVPAEHDKKFQKYFQTSGEAHHHGHAANELSAMIKSGELGQDIGHHENAHAAQAFAIQKHKEAADDALKAGAPWMAQYHGGQIAGHEKKLAVHAKKLAPKKL
jgi:hypothetical protein